MNRNSQERLGSINDQEPLVNRLLEPMEAKERASLGYFHFLQQLGVEPTIHGPWASVGKSTQVQGWKLHLTTIETEAVRLLSRVVPFLQTSGISFKTARDEMTLSQLNEGILGATQVGKFMTIYPASDDEARQLAEKLVTMTRGFHGPIIVTDLRLGDIVYTRYGGFNPIVTVDRLGQVFTSIYAPDGSLRSDSYQVPFSLPAGVDSPFANFPAPSHPYQTVTAGETPDRSPRSDKLFGPGYLLLEVIKSYAKGFVFRGLDLRSQELTSIKIIKQGRQYCLSDEFGRDIRIRLQHQETVHNALAGLVPVPRADPYFEVDADGYLPLEYIEGESIESLAVRSLSNRSWRSLPVEQQIKLLTLLDRLVSAIRQFHKLGYVHRDLTASNIWIGVDNQVYLLDLELAHRVEDQTPAFGLGTVGFMSPQQEARKLPAFADDIYALGCAMILMLTGFDPRRVLFAFQKDRVVELSVLTGGAPQELVEIIARCVEPDPATRPDLPTVEATIQNTLAALSHWGDHGERLVTQNLKRLEDALQGRVAEVIEKAQKGLIEEVIMEPSSGLWLSASMKSMSHEAARSAVGSYELRRDANRGVAGVIYLLGRLARFGYNTSVLRERVHPIIQWLVTQEVAEDQRLPGLHFGKAGMAVAVAEAIAGGLIEPRGELDTFILEALNGKLDWPDVTHGAAGQGIAAIYCFDRLHDPRFLALSHRCTDYLLQTQNDQGAWVLPPGVDGISGQTLTGFAHGVSGIVYYLAEYARRFDSPQTERAWRAGAEWLIRQAEPTEDDQALEWHYSDLHSDVWKWWCHGSPGIALTFLRVFEQTREGAYAEIATKSLRVHPRDIRYQNLSQCHGLSGLGEIYLEAGRVLGDQEWYDRAESIANTLLALRCESENGAITWLVEDPHNATADLMVGSSGVAHFLLRYSLRGDKIGFPLLLDPLKASS